VLTLTLVLTLMLTLTLTLSINPNTNPNPLPVRITLHCDTHCDTWRATQCSSAHYREQQRTGSGVKEPLGLVFSVTMMVMTDELTGSHENS